MADPSTAPPLIPASIAEAHAKIKPYIHRTPLLTSKSLNAIASHPNPSAFLSKDPPPLLETQATTTTPNGNYHTSTNPPKFNLYFKCENLQKIGAFKARGAHHALLRLIDTHGLPHIQSLGVTTHSSGNHAQALALAAHTFNVPSHIVMPTISTPSKIAGTKTYTRNVYFSGSTADEREAKVAEVIERTGAILVPPYDHPDIILGQGTAALEMAEQHRELKREARSADGHLSDTDTGETHLDAVLAPLGGGGLLSGIATWFSTTPTRVYGTEPSHSGANDAQLGLAASPPTRVPHVKSLTIADGLRTPVGLLNWAVVSDRSKVEGVYSVSEAEIVGALKLVLERLKAWVEPSAVVPVAVVLFCHEFRALVARAQAGEGARRVWDVGVVLSGGNTTVEAVGKLFAGEDAEREMAQVGVDGVRVAEDVAG